MDRAESATDAEAIRLQLERILSSGVFVSARRSQAFLRYVVEKSVLGPVPKEYEIAVDVFERSADYDPAVDATVRVEASRLRSRLREYYATQGKHDPILIDLPKGGYSAVFTRAGHETDGNLADPLALTVGPTNAAPTSTPPLIPEPIIVVPAPRRRHLLRLAIIAAGCLGILAIAAWRIGAHSHPAPIRSLAVLPLDNLSGDPSQEYFADGMTDELTTEIARIPNLRVVSRASVMAHNDLSRPIPEIARQLNVDAIVKGSVVRSGDRIRITAQLIDGRSGRYLWAQSFEGPARDVLSLQDSVAQQIATQARLVLVAPSPHPPVDPAAHDAYLRGLYFFNKQDAGHSLESFRQAITIDPTYAAAYAGYASALDAATTFGISPPDQLMPKALAAARRATQLDPQNGGAYTELGSIQTIYLWDWTAASQNLTRGIELNPSDAIGEFKYATYLDAIDRPTAAVDHMRRALTLDPLSFLMNRRLGATLYFARDYDAALVQLNRAAEMEDEPSSIDNYRSLIYEQKGQHDEAVEYDLAALHSVYPQLDTAVLRSRFKQQGWQAYWLARSSALLSTPEQPCTSYQLALDDLRTNRLDKAFVSFNRALDQHCYAMALLRVDPLLDSVRHDPRYTALLTRLHQ